MVKTKETAGGCFQQMSIFDFIGTEEPAPVPVAKVAAKVLKDIEARNYVIRNDNIAVGKASERYLNNLSAIRLLKELENEKRNPTEDEQDTLAKYVGWGGLAKAFEGELSKEIREITTEEEYKSAQGSVLNSHFTAPFIPKAIYRCLRQMGFEKGNILEPSMGVGVYFGALPDSMKESNLYGVEIDELTGRIAKKLYPKADISIMGFEETKYPDNFFDLAVGNVPFGDYSVMDNAYKKLNFRIHDYFIAKSLDKVRPGGIVCFITSTGTMDKKDKKVREYISQRAVLLGAVRLPNNAFGNAGTKVTTDILVLQKREALDINSREMWLDTIDIGDGVRINQYYVFHPDMIVGKLQKVTGPYGITSTVFPSENGTLKEQLEKALLNIRGKYELSEVVVEDGQKDFIPADMNVRNFTYTYVEGKLYFRQDSVMFPVNAKDPARMKALVNFRDIVLECINAQKNDCSDSMLMDIQSKLRKSYADFKKQYGLINNRTNSMAFSEDSTYYLLCSLEIFDDEGEFIGNSDMFTKRTIRSHRKLTSVETAKEALIASMQEYGHMNIDYMTMIYPKEKEDIVSELKDDVIMDPEKGNYVLMDDYLTGNVLEKLRIAKDAAENDPAYSYNVEKLEKALPKRLEATDITIRLGATWVPPEYFNEFMHHIFETTYGWQKSIKVEYAPCNAKWHVEGSESSYSKSNVRATTDYGTPSINGYRLFELCLNLQDAKVYRPVKDELGNIVYNERGEPKKEIDKDATMVAQQKQEAIKLEWDNWVYEDADRRTFLVDLYNEKFNSTVPRTYNGDNLIFPGMDPDFHLRKHQLDAVARVLYGGNSLLAHAVGAGKTAESIAATMELRRLGIASKVMFVVPNHLIGQWASEFLRIYPSANILASRKKDFETKNRKKFISRIATGDWDAVIIGHSQFEKIPLSKETEGRYIEDKIFELKQAIHESSYDGHGRKKQKSYSVKQMELMAKKLKLRLETLYNESKKDNVVNFEELGIDHLVVDESHGFKNLYVSTKLSNVGNLVNAPSQKCTDMELKVRYINESVGEGHGVTFLTGTPVSNSICELFVNMKYLMNDRLEKMGLNNFDAWASTFGEIQTSIELAPEGTKYQAKTRFSKFYNLPELMTLFKEISDIKLAEDLKLPVPDSERHNIVCTPTEFQKEYVASLSERADAVRRGCVEPQEDNMLKITNDGRLCALDQRIIDPYLPDEPSSKVNTLVDNVFRIYKDTEGEKLTQIIFCDSSTPKPNGAFSVYTDIKKKLVEKGVPEDEVKFIHDANTDNRKEELFKKMRTGRVRVMLASTEKAGTGTNVQDRLIALHMLDCPWRPADLEQRIGRIVRQGNRNSLVHIYTYVTKATFDAYNWQVVEQKQKFIGQAITNKSPARSVDDIDSTALSYAEIKALSCGNPLFKEKMETDVRVKKLMLLQTQYRNNRYRMEDALKREFPLEKERLTLRRRLLTEDIETMSNMAGGVEAIVLDGHSYDNEHDCGVVLEAISKAFNRTGEDKLIGSYRGLDIIMSYSMWDAQVIALLKGRTTHRINISLTPAITVKRILDVYDDICEDLAEVNNSLIDIEKKIKQAEETVAKPFEHEEELERLRKRQTEIDTELNLGKLDNSGLCA